MADENFKNYLHILHANGLKDNELPLITRCNANCFFCSNKMHPRQFQTLPLTTLEEVKKAAWISNFKGSKANHFSIHGTSYGDVITGETLLHPQIVEIVKFIRTQIPAHRRIYFTSNGSMLTERLLDQLKEYLPIEINLSFHSLNKENWCSLFSLKEYHYNVARNSIELMTKKGFDFVPSIVVFPSYVGYPDIESTIQYISHYTKKVLIQHPGYAATTEPWIVQRSLCDSEELENFLEKMTEKYNMVFEWIFSKSAKQKNIQRWSEDIIGTLKKGKLTGRRVLFLASHAIYSIAVDYVASLAAEINNHNYKVLLIKNDAFGGNIESAGLWSLTDIESVLSTSIEEKDIVLMPGLFLNHLGFDLFNNHIVSLLEKYPSVDFNFFNTQQYGSED